MNPSVVEYWDAWKQANVTSFKLYMAGLQLAAEFCRLYMEDLFPSRGRRAIQSVTSSTFDEHKVIHVEELAFRVR